MSDKVRVGVIGLGMGRHRVRGYATCDQADLIAVSERSAVGNHPSATGP